MDLSVVVATLDGQDRLSACLDALAAHAGEAEVVVANGPSTDGTTGMVRDRDDVDVLLELADRNVNAARNAGFRSTTGDVVGFVDERSVVEPGWREAVEDAIANGADVVTGPARSPWYDGDDGSGPEWRRIAGQTVRYFDGGNVVFSRNALERIDGFDEYLDEGGSRDAAHRIARLGMSTVWSPAVAVRREPGAVRADGDGPRRWGSKYRSLSYRLAKNYGPRPTVGARTLRHALDDGAAVFREVLAGTYPPSRWVAGGRDVTANCCRGVADGLSARLRSGENRNPNGASSRCDRAVRTYDWR